MTTIQEQLDTLIELLDEHDEVIDFPDEGDLWQKMADLGPPLPCMDLSLELIDESDYYGCDFSGKNQVIFLFFTGSSDFFPGIWINNHQKIDECPIYIFDLSCDQQSFQPVGNLKTYLKTLLEWFLQQKNIHPYYISVAQKILVNIEKNLSDKLSNQETYHLKLIDP